MFEERKLRMMIEEKTTVFRGPLGQCEHEKLEIVLHFSIMCFIFGHGVIFINIKWLNVMVACYRITRLYC